MKKEFFIGLITGMKKKGLRLFLQLYMKSAHSLRNPVDRISKKQNPEGLCFYCFKNYRLPVYIGHILGDHPLVIFFCRYIAQRQSRFPKGAVVCKGLLCNLCRLFIADMG